MALFLLYTCGKFSTTNVQFLISVYCLLGIQRWPGISHCFQKAHGYSKRVRQGEFTAMSFIWLILTWPSFLHSDWLIQCMLLSCREYWPIKVEHYRLSPSHFLLYIRNDSQYIRSDSALKCWLHGVIFSSRMTWRHWISTLTSILVREARRTYQWCKPKAWFPMPCYLLWTSQRPPCGDDRNSLIFNRSRAHWFSSANTYSATGSCCHHMCAVYYTKEERQWGDKLAGSHLILDCIPAERSLTSSHSTSAMNVVHRSPWTLYFSE